MNRRQILAHANSVCGAIEHSLPQYLDVGANHWHTVKHFIAAAGRSGQYLAATAAVAAAQSRLRVARATFEWLDKGVAPFCTGSVYLRYRNGINVRDARIC